MESVRPIWTIGHSNNTFDRFVELLRAHEIEFVVDVRSYPYSRFAPQFNRETLEGALDDVDVRYLYLGAELGGRPAREDHYDAQGRARYDRMAEQPAFQRAVRRLVNGSRAHRVALMCSEAQPRACHRRLLVGRVLAMHEVELRHILPDGTVQREDAVALEPCPGQETLFGEEGTWRSTQSVSHRRRLSTSSVA